VRRGKNTGTGEDRGQGDRTQHLEKTTARPERGAAVGKRAQSTE
jgi:hypothetical protein